MRTNSRPLRSEPEPAKAALRKRTQAALGIRVASAGLVARGVSVRASDVVFVKSLVEDSEGLAGVFAERGGELVIASPASRAADLDRLLADLEVEIGAKIVADPFGDRADEATS